MDTAYQFCRNTLSLMFWAIGAEGVLFFYDLFFHAKASNPFWSVGYNWWPIVGAVFVGAMLISALWMAVTHYALPQRVLRHSAASTQLAAQRALSATQAVPQPLAITRHQYQTR